MKFVGAVSFFLFQCFFLLPFSLVLTLKLHCSKENGIQDEFIEKKKQCCYQSRLVQSVQFLYLVEMYQLYNIFHDSDP